MPLITPPTIDPVVEFPALGDANFNAKAFNWATRERTHVAPQIQASALNVANNAAFAAEMAAAALTNRNQAQVFRDQSAASALSAQQSAASAQGFALQAGMATNVPVLIFQPQRLTTSLAIPNGQNAHTIGPFEVDPSVTVEGVGSATWTGL